MVEPLTPTPDASTGAPAPKLRLRSPFEPPNVAPAPTLTVLDEGGRRGPAFDFVVERPVTMVGRCGELRLEDPLVSRRHVALIRDHEGTLLSDLGSQNPPLVNGVLVIRGATVRLREGDQINLGQTTLVYHAPRPAALPSDSALLGPAPGATPPHPLPPMTGVAFVPVVAPPAPAARPVVVTVRGAPAPVAAQPIAQQPLLFGIVSLMAGLALGGTLLIAAFDLSSELAAVTPTRAAVEPTSEVVLPVDVEAPPASTPELAPTPAPTPPTTTPPMRRASPPTVPVEVPRPTPPPTPTASTPASHPAPTEVPAATRLTCERLLGRAPTPAEAAALGTDPSAWVAWLLAQEAVHSRWWQAELSAFGLGDAPVGPEQDPSLDALREAATSVAFTRRHGGEAPFADAVASLLLGLRDGDPERQRVHDAARHVAAGWPQQALGVEARTPRDLVRAAVKDPRFARAALERALERVLDRSPTAEEVEAAETAFFQDPGAPGALLRVVIRRGLEG